MGRKHCGKPHITGCYCAQMTLVGPHILRYIGRSPLFHTRVSRSQTLLHQPQLCLLIGLVGAVHVYRGRDRDWRVSRLPSLATHPWLTLPHKAASIQPLCLSMAAWFPQKLLPETNKIWFELCSEASWTWVHLLHAIFNLFIQVCSSQFVVYRGWGACGKMELDSMHLIL